MINAAVLQVPDTRPQGTDRQLMAVSGCEPQTVVWSKEWKLEKCTYWYRTRSPSANMFFSVSGHSKSPELLGEK